MLTCPNCARRWVQIGMRAGYPDREPPPAGGSEETYALIFATSQSAGTRPSCLTSERRSRWQRRLADDAGRREALDELRLRVAPCCAPPVPFSSTASGRQVRRRCRLPDNGGPRGVSRSGSSPARARYPTSPSLHPRKHPGVVSLPPRQRTSRSRSRSRSRSVTGHWLSEGLLHPSAGFGTCWSPPGHQHQRRS